MLLSVDSVPLWLFGLCKRHGAKFIGKKMHRAPEARKMNSLGREPQELDGEKEIEPLKGATYKGWIYPAPTHRKSIPCRDSE